MTLNDYLEKGLTESRDIEGFSIGKGKKVYWYITPMPKSCLYRCLPIEPNGTLGWPRFIPGETEIKVVKS